MKLQLIFIHCLEMADRWSSQYSNQKYPYSREERKTTLTQTAQLTMGSQSNANYYDRAAYSNTGMNAPKVGLSEGDMRNQLRLIKSKMSYPIEKTPDIDREATSVSNQLNTLNMRLQEKAVAPSYEPSGYQQTLLPRNRSIPISNNNQGRFEKANEPPTTSNSYNSTNNTISGYPQPRRAPAYEEPTYNYDPPSRYNQLTFQQQQQLKQTNQVNGYQQAQQANVAKMGAQYSIQPSYNAYNPSIGTNAQARSLQKPVASRNPLDEMPAVARNQQRIGIFIGDIMLEEEFGEQDEDLVECPEGCGRQFREDALEKHTKVCKKVFQSKRKEFNSKAHRLVSQEQQKLQKLGQAKDKIIMQKQQVTKQNTQQKSQGKDPKWKQQSEQFRQMLQSVNSGEQATYHDPREDDYVECPGCGRSFNEQAASKHIPTCKNKQAMNRFKGKR